MNVRQLLCCFVAVVITGLPLSVDNARASAFVQRSLAKLDTLGAFGVSRGSEPRSRRVNRASRQTLPFGVDSLLVPAFHSTVGSDGDVDPVVDQTLVGADGNVVGLARSGNTLYIAGSFRSVGESTGGFARLDGLTGQSLRPFPKVAGYVETIVPDGDGGWYIGGQFSAVGGKPRSCLAQIRGDGTVTDWNPGAAGSPGYTDPPHVSALAVNGGTVFVGGGFLSLGGRPHRSLGCVDARTGAAREWNLDLQGGARWVYTLASQDSTVFVGGTFNTIGGQVRYSVAALDAVTGVVRSWTADANGAVWALLPHGDTLYVAGEFGWIAGWYRNFIAAVDAQSGALLPFDAHADFTWLGYGAPPAVLAMALAGDTLYVGGWAFTMLGGQPRQSLAALDARTGDALSWTAPTFGPTFAGLGQGALTLAVRESTLYVGGTFSYIGGVPRSGGAALNRRTANLMDWNPNANYPFSVLAMDSSAVLAGGEFDMLGDWTHRAGLAALDLTTGRVKPWNPNPNGVIATAIAVQNGRVYVSGDFTTIGGDPQPRSAIAALDTLNGEVTNWNPGADDVVSSFLVAGDTLYASGWFTQIAGQPRNYLAALSMSSGELLDWNPDADLPVTTMAMGRDALYVGGEFDHVGGQPRGGLAAVDPVTGAVTAWDPGTDNHSVDVVLTSSDKVYVGGGFGSVGGQPRNAIAVLDATSGAALPWYPMPSRWGSPMRVQALALIDSTLYVGGNFAGMGGQPRICLAAVDTSTAQASLWDPGLNGVVWSLAAEGTDLYVGGGFTRAGGIPTAGLAAFAIPRPTLPEPPVARVDIARVAPNPVTASASMRYGLPAAAAVTLEVFDTQGRRIETVLGGSPQTAGWHEQALHADGWPRGVYFCRLSASGIHATRKFVVLH